MGFKSVVCKARAVNVLHCIRVLAIVIISIIIIIIIIVFQRKQHQL